MSTRSFIISVIGLVLLLTFIIQFQQPPTTANYQPATLEVTLSPTPTLTLTPTPLPTPQLTTTPPQISAQSYIIQDLNTDTVLAQKDSHHVLPPASTTKIMTALIALDNYQLTDVVTVPNYQVLGAKIELYPGETMTVENLLYGMLMQSGNDAAWALASHYPGGVPAFIDAMNRKAIELGLEQTHFVNPTGLHDPLHLSSTADLLKLAKVALGQPIFAQIVATKEKTITSVDQQTSHEITNLNQLLTTVPGVKGVKTGWTEQAKEALVTLIDRDGHSVLIAMLASEDRFGDTRELIDWVYRDTIWQP